jgi:hypothetical protein
MPCSNAQSLPHTQALKSLIINTIHHLPLAVHNDMTSVQHVDEILQASRSLVANECFARNVPMTFEKECLYAKIKFH